MKAISESTWTFQMIIFFILIFACFLTLVLSYNITEDLIGNIVNNNAEIYESYNEQGLQDIDSKAGNEIPTEDDMSNADIAVSIVTGKIVGYTTLTLFILAIFFI